MVPITISELHMNAGKWVRTAAPGFDRLPWLSVDSARFLGDDRR